MDRPDQGLRTAIVANRLAGRLYPARNRRVRYDPAIPDFLDEFILCHHAAAAFDQYRQEREYLRLDGADHAVRAQLKAARVELKFSKLINHRWQP